jgi:SAM-dependent methyltransferase
MAECNICGNGSFEPGPGGRLWKGMPIRCSSCRSLERHRAIRSFYDRLLRSGLLKSFGNALQFSKDPCVPPGCFSRHTVSIYGGPNSMDIKDTQLESSSVDWIICNHVLEHIDDDRKAVNELMRVLSSGGVLQLNVPGPPSRGDTIDWGFPDPSDHDHYREYGDNDFLDRFKDSIDLFHASSLKLSAIDPVTKKYERIFILTKRPAVIDLFELVLSSSVS